MCTYLPIFKDEDIFIIFVITHWNCAAVWAVVFSVSTTDLIGKGLELKRLCMGPPWIQTPVTGPDESLQLGLDHDMGFHVFNLN